MRPCDAAAPKPWEATVIHARVRRPNESTRFTAEVPPCRERLRISVVFAQRA